MEAELLPEVQKVVRPNDHILRRHGIALGKDARILDFGCWSGRHTYEYLDAGYERVVGFDIEDHVSLRKDSDRDRFRFSEPGGTYRIPFPDNHFDFITSISVFEHVTNQAETITEIARGLKPDGVTLHVFPSRWRPIETHMFVPFGGAIQARCWISLWARLGIRGGGQRNLTAREVVSDNLAFCATGIRYLDFEDIDALWRNRFACVEYAEPAFIESTRHVSTVSRIMHPLIKALPGFLGLYRFAHTRVVLARKPH